MQLSLLCRLAFMLIAVQLPPLSWQGPLPKAADNDELKLIFTGRCEEFQFVLHPELFNQPKNCTQLWQGFESAAYSTGSCRAPDPDAFAELLQLAEHRMPSGKFVFWSGVYDLMAKFRDLRDYYPIVKTLLGHSLDGLDWCKGNCSESWLLEAEEALSYPQENALENAGRSQQFDRQQSSEAAMAAHCSNFTIPFWIAASKWYAVKAVGPVAYLILNASVETPFRNNSIFAEYELPRLSHAQIAYFEIYLVSSLDDTQVGATCGHQSVLVLERMLRAKGILVRCTENPNFLVHLLCADQPDAQQCKLIGGGSGRHVSSLQWTAVATLLAIFTKTPVIRLLGFVDA